MWFLICAVLVVLLWSLVHELSHAVAVIILGGKVKSIRFWPHKVDGELYYGRITWSGVHGDLTWIKIAPYVFDAVVFVSFYTALWFLDGLHALSVVLILCCPVVNTGVGVLGRYRQVHDKVTDLSGVSWKVAVVFLYLWTAYIASLFFYHGWMIGG